ncbi:DegV family protein [Salinispora arenicola]|uniref:DegV family protein n=1 Tax=Salinispora arenicola TaxID=168697 RepID=UPI00207AF806|nr:DegV family protein [Salinispora arenicola]MCN0179595.1 DegV family protein [Salinispora arenicola]
MPVAVVTDSTAYLPAKLMAIHRLTMVPLTVVLNGAEGLEGVESFPADATRALNGRRVSVSTSRPAPAQFVRTYRRLLDGGADGIVSVHLSAELSGTVESARLAAADFGGRVAVVDSRSCGMGTGFPAVAAAEAAAAGVSLTDVRDAAQRAVARTTIYFYVDTLEFLRRGGRINAASALLGTALSVKPIMYMPDGAIVLRDRVRTVSRGVARLVDLAVEAAGEADVDLALHHLAAPQRAEALRVALAVRLGDRLRDTYVSEAGAVVAAHAGPGLAGVVVHRRPDEGG